MLNNGSSSSEKIALFRSLFRGREDVYPRRFENRKTGRSGYAPACRNEWVSGVCQKPKIKCSDCPHRNFFPITNEIIEAHLLGVDRAGKDFVMGIYPMLLDETCFFLSVDFDKKSWKEDAMAFLKTCSRMNLSAALERSRSGQGGHVWMFFEEALPATLVRKLGSHILTKTMEQYPNIGFDSYDRFFPNQDTLPRGGFGNLIALPLQKKARQAGNSSFIDERFQAFEDQWSFLAQIKKIGRSQIEEIVTTAESKGKVMGVRLDIQEEEDFTPWKKRPSGSNPVLSAENLPQKLELILGNEIFIEKENLPPPLINHLIRLAAFQNPEFYKAQAMRLPVYDKPRIISCAHDYPKHLGLPRGCLEEISKCLKNLGIKISMRDELFHGEALSTKFLGQLRTEQLLAAEAMNQSDIGVLSATTAFGKTVVGSWLIAERGVNTLIIVHRKQLQDQWEERLAAFLDISKKDIGAFGGGRKKLTGKIDIAILQSLTRKNIVHDLIANYGHIIVDECHHVPAVSFENVICQAKAKYITGLSATVARKDGHHPIITMRCGPVRYSVSAKEQAKVRPFEYKVLIRPTLFHSMKSEQVDQRIQFHNLTSELIADIHRNQLICDDAISALQHDRSPLILTERNDHLDILSTMLRPHVQHLIVLRGSMGNKAIKETMKHLQAVPKNERRLLLATGKFIGEGFDDSRLDTLLITLPVSWKGTIAQYVGRLHRLHDFKKEVQVYDYADFNVPMLERMFQRRCRAYESLGYNILLPASATPGWPSSVPLPSDPAWKGNYSSSVQRLIRDGVDETLATLFTQCTVTVFQNEKEKTYAHSASEAFLYRRLESLPETKGRFKLNATLPIPFDHLGFMEVDLLCSDACVAIEVDGLQHLNDKEAYRCDRRKDMLLQESGYTVLRFLAEDLGTHLHSVLDAILRTLIVQQGRSKSTQ